MERIMKQSRKAPSPLGMQTDSHVISKFKPKIRIVHIYAPEIIKTDVEHFRELVQKLTGKPTTTDQKSGKKKATTTKSQDSITTTESEDGYRSWGCFERIKDEEEDAMWGGENSSCFFNGYGDLDGFIQGLGEFPLLPLTTSSHMDLFGESQLC